MMMMMIIIIIYSQAPVCNEQHTVSTLFLHLGILNSQSSVSAFHKTLKFVSVVIIFCWCCHSFSYYCG